MQIKGVKKEVGNSNNNRYPTSLKVEHDVPNKNTKVISSINTDDTASNAMRI